MNARNLIAASALVLSAAVAAPAMAGLSTGNLALDVESALGSGGNVRVELVDGVATLTGNVKDAGTKAKVRQLVQANADVDSVVNQLVY